MKLRILHICCYLCVLCTLAQPDDEIGWENQTISTNPSNVSSSREAKEPLNVNNPRDKRALGLILSGLAQVFGYTVNPVQIASLTNPNVRVDEARVPRPAANGNQTSSASASSSNSTRSDNSSSTATPRQRETIRFTGVLNFGNNTGLLNHLQEYERIFHGGDNSSSSTTFQPSPMLSTTQPPRMNMRPPDSNRPMFPPLLVKIPLPAVSEPPLPAMPQPPLPEIPSQDIMLSYPEPLFPIRHMQQTEYSKNEDTEKMTFENKQIFNGMEVQSPPPPTTYTPSTVDPLWRKEYEERLTELERKQAEQAERLRQQEWYRNRQKEDNYSGEENDKQYDGRGKPVGYGGQDFRCRDGERNSLKGNRSMEEEYRSSGERYESGERIRDYSTSERPKGFEGSVAETEEERYRDNYNNDNVFKYKDNEDTPQISENYTDLGYNEPLPLSEDDEQRRPEELRNSYGELLHNRELFDDAFADYFGKLKQPLTGLYSPSVPVDSKNVASKGEFSDEKREEDEDERVQEKDDIPARNKYEEYSLEEDAGANRGGGQDSSEENVDTGSKYLNVLTDGKNRSYYDEEKSMESVDFGKHMPLLVPIRYLSAPEELRKVESSYAMTNKLEKDNNVLGAEPVTKVLSKDLKSSRKDDSKPTILFSARETPRKLHEGEEKKLQAWPPPFDFVVDSTIHTNVVPTRLIHNDDIKAKNSRRRPESSGRGKEEMKQERERRVITDNLKYKLHGFPENVSYEHFKKAIEHGAISGTQSTLNEPVNTKRQNRMHIEDNKSDRSNQRKEMSDFWKGYNKHGSNHNYGNTKNSNIAIQRSMEEEDKDLLYATRLDNLKRSIEKPESIEREYYTETYPIENKAEIIGKNDRRQGALVRPHKSEAVTVFVPSTRYNYFDFGDNTYGSNYGREKAKLSRVLTDNKKTVNGDLISLTMPQPDAYRYDEGFTKFTSEPESKGVQVGDRDSANDAATMKIIGQERISSNKPISYIDYPRIL